MSKMAPFFTLPLVGRVDRPNVGGGGGERRWVRRVGKLQRPPSRLASLGDLPHKGGGKETYAKAAQ